MRKRLSQLFFVAVLAAVAFGPTFAAGQGTPHGIEVTITAPAVGASAGNGNTVASYNIYRCPGTCTATGSFAKIDTTPDLSLGYLDPSSDPGVTAGSTYTYAATVVDNKGNESVFSPLATVTVPSAGFPANPSAPSGCNAAVQ
jgi:hypothetical protein